MSIVVRVENKYDCNLRRDSGVLAYKSGVAILTYAENSITCLGVAIVEFPSLQHPAINCWSAYAANLLKPLSFPPGLKDIAFGARRQGNNCIGQHRTKNTLQTVAALMTMTTSGDRPEQPCLPRLILGLLDP